MKAMLLEMYVKFQNLVSREEGQDLVEYALVLGIIALGSVALLTSVATNVNVIYTNVVTALTNAA
jgi:pilus assembly protein Flp/PilA